MGNILKLWLGSLPKAQQTEQEKLVKGCIGNIYNALECLIELDEAQYQ